MKSIIEYFCPLCIAPIVNAIGGETGNARFSKDIEKDEPNHTTRNIIIGVIIALVVLGLIMFFYYRKRLSLSSFSPNQPISSCGCGLS